MQLTESQLQHHRLPQEITKATQICNTSVECVVEPLHTRGTLPSSVLRYPSPFHLMPFLGSSQLVEWMSNRIATSKLGHTLKNLVNPIYYKLQECFYGNRFPMQQLSLSFPHKGKISNSLENVSQRSLIIRREEVLNPRRVREGSDCQRRSSVR